MSSEQPRRKYDRKRRNGKFGCDMSSSSQGCTAEQFIVS
jgi:hypothetical protein